MELITHSQLRDWLSQQGWVSVSDTQIHLAPVPGHNLTSYEFSIAEDSATVGCEMAPLLLDGFGPTTFPGGLFWIARTVGAIDGIRDTQFTLLHQVLRGSGVAPPSSWRDRALLLGPDDFEAAVALVALALMFGWDTSLATVGRRYLLTTDDEPFPAVTTDQLGPTLAAVVTEPSMNVRITSIP